jgi:HPt (histidine-containing phosphotransfer) domain-containing protein
MKNINYNNELLNLADDMNVSIIVIGKECCITDANRQGENLIVNLEVDREKPCSSLFNGLSDPCESCPYKSLIQSGRTSTVKEQTLSNGMVKKVVYRLTEEGDAVYIAFLDLYEDSQSETLLKQSERLKRVLLDNLNSSILIINGEGDVERAHFVGDISVVLGKRSLFSSLDKIFNREISLTILSKVQNMTTKDSRNMCHFRFEIKGQILWLDIFISSIEGDKFFLSILDKTSEHYLLERMEKLSDMELGYLKVNEVSSKLSNLMSGLSGYTEMAIDKCKDQDVQDILNNMKPVIENSLNLLDIINNNFNEFHLDKKIDTPSLEYEEKDHTDDASSYLNVEKALELLENNNELYNTVVEDFINDYGNVIERLAFLFESDHEGAQILVHSIKGVAGILGAYTLQDEANLLEGYIRHKEWDEAEISRLKFSEILSHVLKELKQINNGEGRMKDEDKWSLHGMSLNTHQADLLKENISMAEAGDYNGLKDNLKQFSSFDWGSDWTEITRILTEQVENIDFDGVLKSIHSLID